MRILIIISLFLCCAKTTANQINITDAPTTISFRHVAELQDQVSYRHVALEIDVGSLVRDIDMIMRQARFLSVTKDGN